MNWRRILRYIAMGKKGGRYYTRPNLHDLFLSVEKKEKRRRRKPRKTREPAQRRHIGR